MTTPLIRVLTAVSAAAVKLCGAALALRLFRVVVFALIAFSAGLPLSASAFAETRSLKLYYIHTKEKAEIVFKRNGRYDQAGLRKLNRFLRDWRRNEPTKMDPRLFDLVWEVYRQTKARDYIHVVSAYRSPATNAMLRRTRGGQAKRSQHLLGKALDFYIPGVKISKLRAAGMKLQGGGVGYYPKSGSPFVHLDVAGVRAWPRMSRKELSKLFPKGKTLHLPPDGKPLPGYKVALAEYKARGGAIVSSGGGDTSNRAKGRLLTALFGGGDEGEEPKAVAVAPTPRPAPPRVDIAALPAAADLSAPAVVSTLKLPERAPIPVARPIIEQPVVVAALAPPTPLLPAQTDIEAFAAAANVAVAGQQDLTADQPRVRAPVPQLLAERSLGRNGAELAALTTSTSLRARIQTAVEPTRSDQELAELANVRASTDSSVSADAAADGETWIALLPTGDDFVPLPIRRPVSGDRPASIEQASLVSFPAQRGNRLAPSTGSISPRKGDRPNAATAVQAQRIAVRVDPVLTETIIMKWALARQRVETLQTPAKAHRFVDSQLRATPTEVYARGFSTHGGDLPHNRFSGPAVYFISVARFGS